ncbi:hypothetical protein EHQ27_18075 [Leptospira wolffii]|uniref:TolC family protein n=2 Tax=Leptospira wolffii TaxID=409998 RepID=A0A2M9ZEM2_9LEPT|nr:TolC family protein [Leptospira wolffii]PJZ66863.1 hypothetical protein CH371_01835 [Leptospira wolffii]TGK61833.1 hypothetical protein EHQ32_02990 [Leptospira wolffii]TGK65920.1 hypothetical protein EHQ27_18075 [Leptospira wolffii]TGK74783.1 hypothetical protein EHQ35_10790 [Leptospira wolffii]TGL30849.1 hypothetical protein EHQ57_05405 [Leptospira wolffii]
MKTWRMFLLSFGVALLFPNFLFAQERKDFQSVWEKVREHSPTLLSKSLEMEAAKSASFRAGLHWLPRIYSDIRTYNTDDPTLNFAGKLGQRSATQSDFSTYSVRSNPGNYLDSNNQPYQNLNSNTSNLLAKDTLNHPGANTYSRGTLGLEITLYEGGYRSTLKKVKEKEWEASRSENEYIKRTIFQQTAIAYQASLVYSGSIKERKRILEELDSFLRSYRLDSTANPVGHSGYLALKSLRLRLLSEQKEVELLKKESLETLRILSGNSLESFEPQESPFMRFLEDYMPIPSSKVSGNTPLSKTYKIQSEIGRERAKMEKSKFLPKAGVYTEAYAYAGDRNFASSYNAGVYLQMNLLNPTDIGSKKEADILADAAATRADEISAKENSNFIMLLERERTLSENRTNSLDSFRIQFEQLKLSQTLFKRGNIPAAQLAESFSRTADALKAMDGSTLEYLRTRAELTLYAEENHERSE